MDGWVGGYHDSPSRNVADHTDVFVFLQTQEVTRYHPQHHYQQLHGYRHQARLLEAGLRWGVQLVIVMAISNVTKATGYTIN